MESFRNQSSNKKFANQSTFIEDMKISQRSLSKEFEFIYSKYRNFTNQTSQSLESNFLCFWFTPVSKRKKCDCEEGSDGNCSLAVKWIQLIYESKQIQKLKQLYERYRKNKRIQLNEYQSQITEDISVIKNTWTQVDNQILREVLLNFAKHNIYYRRQPYCRMYAWLAAGLLYHCNPYQAFWILDTLTEKIGVSQLNFNLLQPTKHIHGLVWSYFKNVLIFLEQKDIDINAIIEYFLSDMMSSYLPIHYFGFNIQYIITNEWIHINKLLLSYFDKRFQLIQNKKLRNRQDILRCLLNNDTQWPLIFCNMNAFKI